MNTPPIIIAGGGIAGLSAALALGRHDTMILERAPAFSEVGAGLQIGPNAVRALRKLGAWDAVEPVTSSPPEIHMRDGLSGKLLKRLKLGMEFEARFGAPYRVAHRADLHAALLDVVRTRNNITCELASAIDDIALQLDNVAIKSKDEWRTTPYLLAADGVQSKIRQTLFPGSAAINSGHVLHRALVDMPATTGIDMSCVHLWMFPGGHVVHYPVSHQPRLNLVAVTPEGTTPGHHFSSAAPGLQHVLQSAQAAFSPWPGLYAPGLQGWTKGNVFLLGDAAHATLPYLAQGAAMALEDAACLSDALNNAHSLKHAFAETSAKRRARAMRLQEQSLATGRLYHWNGLTRKARNVALVSTPASIMLAKLSWIYRG